MSIHWDNMTDKEVLDLFAEDFIAKDRIPDNFEYGVRKCLQLLVKANLTRMKLNDAGMLVKI